MSRWLVLSVALLCCVRTAVAVASPVPAEPQPVTLDTLIAGEVRVETPVDACLLWTASEQLARQVGFVMGFEHEASCVPARTTAAARDGLVFTGMTLREALDALVAMQPSYAWFDQDGTIAIRPRDAWADPDSILARPVKPFVVRGAYPREALLAVLQSASPSLFEQHIRTGMSRNERRLSEPYTPTLIDTPITVSFPGGTLLDALNAVAGSVSGTWRLAYLVGRLHISVWPPVFGAPATVVSAATDP